MWFFIMDLQIKPKILKIIKKYIRIDHSILHILPIYQKTKALSIQVDKRFLMPPHLTLALMDARFFTRILRD